MTGYDVTLIPGDGIGPEITAQTVKDSMERAAPHEVASALAGEAERRKRTAASKSMVTSNCVKRKSGE